MLFIPLRKRKQEKVYSKYFIVLKLVGVHNIDMLYFMAGDSYCHDPDGGSDTTTGPPLEVSALDTSQSDQGQYSLLQNVLCDK